MSFNSQARSQPNCPLAQDRAPTTGTIISILNSKIKEVNEGEDKMKKTRILGVKYTIEDVNILID